MSFLDDVDTLKCKAGISHAKVPVVIGLGIALFLALACAAALLWSTLTSPSLEIGHDGEVNQVQTQSEDQDGASSQEQSVPMIYVHVAGSVKEPGLYELAQGSRVSDAISAAGGFTSEADQKSINLARVVEDGEQILVTEESQDGTISSSEGSESGNVGSTSGKININTASREELMELDGVGEATADKIISYRQQEGPFGSIEEIKEVSGIGDKKYEAMKEFITV